MLLCDRRSSNLKNLPDSVLLYRGFESACLCLQSSLGADVDITRIGLWGTSLAGGHALVTAAKEGTNVTAVVSQVVISSSH